MLGYVYGEYPAKAFVGKDYSAKSNETDWDKQTTKPRATSFPYVPLKWPNSDIFQNYGTLDDPKSQLSKSQFILIRHGFS